MAIKSTLKKIIHPAVWQFLKEHFKNEVEEIFLVKKYFNSKKHGTMIDVGACHGSSFLPFIFNNWDVYAFEPDLNNFKYLTNYLTKWNLTNRVVLSNNAVSDQKGELSFYKSKDSIGISSLNNFHHNHEFSHKVKTTTLNKVIEKHQISQVDFLKIDTEGFDYFVLKGLNFKNISPTFILCEFEDLKTQNQGYSFKDLISFLESKGYRVVISLWHPIVKYGGNHKWDKFTTRIEDVKKESWGNLLAVEEKNFSSLLTICNLD